jgi:hypothetical protein
MMMMILFNVRKMQQMASFFQSRLLANVNRFVGDNWFLSATVAQSH